MTYKTKWNLYRPMVAYHMGKAIYVSPLHTMSSAESFPICPGSASRTGQTEGVPDPRQTEREINGAEFGRFIFDKAYQTRINIVK